MRGDQRFSAVQYRCAYEGMRSVGRRHGIVSLLIVTEASEGKDFHKERVEGVARWVELQLPCEA